MQREIEELRAAVDQENRAKQDADKNAKSLELQLAEVQTRCDEQVRQLGDFQSLRGRLGNENNDLARQLEDLESQLAALQRLKMQLTSQLEEARRTADDESKVRNPKIIQVSILSFFQLKEKQSLAAQLRNAQHEADSLREQLEAEAEGKSELQRQMSKANGEIQQWKARFENEGLSKIDEIEEAK